jgi:macrolide-specific efflux system membrane fusion protein
MDLPVQRAVRFALYAAPVVLAAVIGAWLLWPSGGSGAARPATVKVTIGNVEDAVSAVGILQPLDYVDVGTQVSGQLQKILVEPGAKVEKGQLLAQIDPVVYQARVSANEAQLMNLRAQLSDKEAQKVLSDQQLRRQRDLLASRATSQDAYDVAEATLKSAAAQIAMIQAQIKQTESTLNGDRASLSYTQIFAPMTGTVVSISAKQGQTLNANQSAPIILRIADLDTMTVWTQVSEADVNRLKIGMTAYFTTLGQPDRRREGKLRQVMPTPQVVNNVVLYDSLFDVKNPDLDLLPQMSAQVFFVAGSARRVPLVPVAALQPIRNSPVKEDGSREYRVRVLENGELVDRTVTIGVASRVSAEVKSGLKEGDEVALDQASAPRAPAKGGGGAPGGLRTPRL